MSTTGGPGGLAAENAARILAGGGSPKILIGGMTLGVFPNFHIGPMIEMGASCVGISCDPKPGRPDILQLGLQENISKAVDRLPSKWRPDFFLDLQAEHGHWLPIGLSELNCPTIATFNHAHLGHVLWHLRGMFDCLVAPSSQVAHWGDHWFPWSASWGTMDARIDSRGCAYAGGAKDVDVVCILGLKGLGKNSIRHAVFSEMRRLKETRSELRFEILEGGLSFDDYLRLLARSKVCVNVGTWGSPVGYRPLEAISQGCALVHVDEVAYGSTAKLSEVFDRAWYVEAEVLGLEAALDEAMGRARWASLVKPALEDRYSYRRQFERLFALAGNTKIKHRLPARDWSRRAFAIGHLTGFEGERDVHAWSLTRQDLDIRPGYKPDVNLWQPTETEARWEFQTALSRGEDPVKVYNHYL